MKNQTLQLLKRARKTCSELSILTAERKNSALMRLADELESAQLKILKANLQDVRKAKQNGLSPALIDRLTLDSKQIAALAQSVRDVAKLPDPVGEIVEEKKRDGLHIQRVRIPIGLIAVVYESRPNVTIDAAVLCFKSGNAVVLRGGSEALKTNQALAQVIKQAFRAEKIPADAVTVLPDADRKRLVTLAQAEGLVDVLIPRGGPNLMEFVRKYAKVPVIKHDRGVCSLFVDESADLVRAVEVVINAKAQRPGTCNALEVLYVHQKILLKFLQILGPRLQSAGVTVLADRQVKKVLSWAKLVKAADFAKEHLSLVLTIGSIANVNEAIQAIRKNSSHHTESILSEDPKNIRLFVDGLDSACVMVNSSTRLHDGGCLGLGAEIGISTTKLHAYGAMGPRELTAVRYVVVGDYTVRP